MRFKISSNGLVWYSAGPLKIMAISGGYDDGPTIEISAPDLPSYLDFGFPTIELVE